MKAPGVFSFFRRERSPGEKRVGARDRWDGRSAIDEGGRLFSKERILPSLEDRHFAGRRIQSEIFSLSGRKSRFPGVRSDSQGDLIPSRQG